jgi:hypothetical protein
MQIFKYFPYTKTINSIIGGFRLYEGDGDGGGGSAGNSNTGGDKGSAGSGNAGGSGGNGNTIKLEDVPQDIINQLFNKGFAKGKEKADGLVKEKLAEMGISDEQLEKWKKMEADADENSKKKLEEKGEYDKLKTQMVEQHNKKVVELNDTISAKDRTIHRLVVRNQLIAEAAVDCVNPTHVANLLESNFKAEEINGEWCAVAYKDGTKLVDADGNPQTVKVFIENWLKLEENSYFKKSGVGQGGTGSKGTGTGYKKDGTKINKKFLTSQGAIRSGLKKGSSILNSKIVINSDDGDK